MIDFEIAPLTKDLVKLSQEHGKVTRHLSRYYDEYEHEHDDLMEEDAKIVRQHQKELMALMANPDGKEAEAVHRHPDRALRLSVRTHSGGLRREPEKDLERGRLHRREDDAFLPCRAAR